MHTNQKYKPQLKGNIRAKIDTVQVQSTGSTRESVRQRFMDSAERRVRQQSFQSMNVTTEQQQAEAESSPIQVIHGKNSRREPGSGDSTCGSRREGRVREQSRNINKRHEEVGNAGKRKISEHDNLMEDMRK